MKTQGAMLYRNSSGSEGEVGGATTPYRFNLCQVYWDGLTPGGQEGGDRGSWTSDQTQVGDGLGLTISFLVGREPPIAGSARAEA